MERSSASSGLLVWVVLALSFAVNGLLILRRRARSVDCPSKAFAERLPDISAIDSDGDGIPDHHDFCPSVKVCLPGDGKCAPSGWISGRATDFDADGCADGTEDADKDNDGIMDPHDACPFTPQKYSFVSDTHSDFDGDGCADGLEDTDDDGDAVPNFIDSCPRTAAWDVSDKHGCSKFQHDRPETLELHRILALQGISASPSPHKRHTVEHEEDEEQPTRLQGWIDLWHGNFWEVIVGAVLSAAFGYAHDAYSKLHEKLPAKPSESVRRLSSGMVEGISSVRRMSASSIVSVQPQTLSSVIASWTPSADSLLLHSLRIAGYLIVVYVSRYHREVLSIAGMRAGLSSGALCLSSLLQSLAESLSAR